jgi:nucleoside triphosphatase YtkD
LKKFPVGPYGRQKLQFYPAPFRAPLRAFAGLVFPWLEDKVLICDIEDRGWCIPSGRVEPDESSLEAVIREALEEGGVEIEDVQYIGCYQVSERQEIRWADVYAARIAKMVEITMTEESLGRKLVTMEELPDIYHLWTPLTAMVFEHAREIVTRNESLRRGS